VIFLTAAKIRVGAYLHDIAFPPVMAGNQQNRFVGTLPSSSAINAGLGIQR
jgi:hypothetical protein